MRRFAWTLTAIGIAGLTTAAHAETASKEESIGFGTGGVVGAVAGGPVGFIIGAALGAKIGDTLHGKNETIAALDDDRRVSEISVRALRRDVDSLSSKLDESTATVDRLERAAHPELVSLMQAGVDLDLLFRTDEASLLADTDERLAELGARLASMPGLQIHLDGFADERGDTVYNQRLSEQRIAYVRERLIEAGVDPSRITEIAHGEVPAAEANDDSYALERRVNLKVFLDPDAAVASNP
jgi:outer membrane protein OmpA-like peptidoglycan-associated protein